MKTLAGISIFMILATTAIVTFGAEETPPLTSHDAVPAQLASIDSISRPENFALPSPRKRDALLRSAGLHEDVKAWDELDKNLLILRARTSSQEKLERTYSGLSKESLKKLKEKLAQRKS
jgi:hypothetical protein